jgi:hypothetical protein
MISFQNWDVALAGFTAYLQCRLVFKGSFNDIMARGSIVFVKQGWIDGASRWTSEKREAFANADPAMSTLSALVLVRLRLAVVSGRG